MTVVFLENKETIAAYCRRNVYLHLYSLGDLDDFFWPHTTWYGLDRGRGPEAIALLYTGLSVPALLALCSEPSPMRDLLVSILHLLPKRFYTHLTPGLEEAFQDTHSLEPHGAHYKMALRDPSKVQEIDGSQTFRLTPSDAEEVLGLYKLSYPGHWFEPQMLESGQYFGIRKENALVSLAGVHVFSETYGVAALGNIATHPAYRNHGHGTRVTARLCRSLTEKVKHIGLNVKTDNHAALSCYRKLGFDIVATYGEFMVEEI
jgi:ribosomal protein S18 acetylase RimI-like enzyme